MVETSENNAVSAAAAAAKVAISQTVSALLDSATTSAAKASTAPGTSEGVSGLKAGSIESAGMAETVSNMLESATTTAVAATQGQEHQIAVDAERASATAAEPTLVPPLSPLGPTVEHSASGIELSGRLGHGEEESSDINEFRRNDGATANVADRSQDSRGQLEPVIISDGGRLVCNEVEVKEEHKGGVEECTAEKNETIEERQGGKGARQITERKDVDEVERKEEERMELLHDGDDRAARSSRGVDVYKTNRTSGVTSVVEDVPDRYGREERQQDGGHTGEKNEAAGEGSTTPNDRPFAATTAAPQIAPSQLTEGGGDIQQQWQWWDKENPWSRGSRPSTSTDRKSTERKLSETAVPPPVYQETTPPPPYQEVVTGLRAPRSSMQKHIIEQQEGPSSSDVATSNRRALLSASAVSNDASSSSGDDTSRGSPPSYHAAVVRVTGSPSSSEREEEKQPSSAHLPPPSYGRFFDDVRSALSPLQGETTSNGAKPDGGEWWTHGDHDHQYAPVWNGEGRGQERERGRRRTRVSSGSMGVGDGSGLQSSDRPETIVDEHEEEKLGGTSWSRRQHSKGQRKKRTAASSSRPRTTMLLPPGKSGNKDTTLSNTKSWDDDRWRLTRYLQSCKRELAEAEERRRRAEAAANAAERKAWAAGNSKGGEDDGEKRAWARAATQRVLDLMLVTERVRQEEQKRRVAAARASNQVARCKQPFRERRGRSQKGPFIGPSVPPADVPEPPRSQQHMEAAAMRDIYWDEHGRRYSRRRSNGNGIDDQDRTSGEVGVALEIVRKVAGSCLEEGTDFGQPFREIDSDGDGRLTLAELGAALRRTGVRLSLSQITALFRHFDEGLGLDTVGRGQVLWEFVDTKRLLEQWRKAGDVRGGHRARIAPLRNRAIKASYGGGRGGGDDGTLSRHDFLLSLEELGVRVDGWEADALLNRFTIEDGSNHVDWVAFVSFMQAAENKHDANSNSGNSGIKVATRAERERAGLRTSVPRHSRHQQRHSATSGLHRGGGLFEGEGNITSWGRPARQTETTKPKTGGKPYYHWASSAPSSADGWRTENTIGNEAGPTRSRTRTGSAGRRLSSEVVMEGSAPPLSLRSRVPRGGRGARGGGLMTNVADASRMLDGLLENQQELEAFLEEEIAKREREGRRGGGGAGGRGSIAWRQEIG